jgi:hypothetical protein
MKTITEQTGWRRPHSRSICQDVTVLIRVTRYSYDLCDERFVDYLRARIGSAPRKAASGFDRFCELDAMTEAEYRRAHECRWSLNQKHEYTADEIELNMEVRRIRKGAYQDCWELYLNQNPK